MARRPRRTGPPPPHVDAFADALVDVAGYSPKTASNYRLYVTGFCDWWGRDPAEATTADLRAYLAAEARRGIAPATRQSIVHGLRAFYAHLTAEGLIDADPAAALATPRVPPPYTDIYRPAEVERILGHLAGLTDHRGRQRHAIVATLRYTGMRASELRHLELARLDLDARRGEVIGKNSRHRVLVLPVALTGILTGFLAEVRPHLPASRYVFAHPGAVAPQAPYTLRSLYDEVVRAGNDAGVATSHRPHKWRHTYATELLRAGLDLHTVQRLLGHRNVTATVRYTHLDDDDLRNRLDTVW